MSAAIKRVPNYCYQTLDKTLLPLLGAVCFHASLASFNTEWGPVFSGLGYVVAGGSILAKKSVRPLPKPPLAAPLRKAAKNPDWPSQAVGIGLMLFGLYLLGSGKGGPFFEPSLETVPLRSLKEGKAKVQESLTGSKPLTDHCTQDLIKTLDYLKRCPLAKNLLETVSAESSISITCGEESSENIAITKRILSFGTSSEGYLFQLIKGLSALEKYDYATTIEKYDCQIAKSGKEFTSLVEGLITHTFEKTRQVFDHCIKKGFWYQKDGLAEKMGSLQIEQFLSETHQKRSRSESLEFIEKKWNNECSANT